MMGLQQLLRMMAEHNASDLHLQTGHVPVLRIEGQLRRLDGPPIENEAMIGYVQDLCNDISQRDLAGKGSTDLSYELCDDLRFRINVFHQRGRYALAIRRVFAQVPSIQQLNLPPILAKIADLSRGLVLVSGTTSSGKSTTIASMIDQINRAHSRRIITIEDPIEYVHRSQKSLVAQIEVGQDTESYEVALRQLLRQDPDVVMIGELREATGIQVALRAADTGHLVFATVHASDAQQTIERLIAMFDQTLHQLLLTQLSMNLQAVIALRLAQARSGGRVPVVELLRATPVVRKLILEGRASHLSTAIGNRDEGMQTFDQHLVELFQARIVGGQEALLLASNRDALELAMRGITTSDMGRRIVR